VISSALDTVLDRTIAPGYGRLGLSLRRRLPDWPADPPRIDGAVVLVTGAAAGIGLAAAQGFAALGASVRVLGRSEERAAAAVDAVRRSVPGADVAPESCDLGDLHAVGAFARDFAAREQRLDVLVDNAGVMPAERTTSSDGHELTFATHVLASFALTALLADLLGRSAPARVINVSSGGMYAQPLRAVDPESHADDYSPKTFYARTKRQQVVLSELWASRLAGTGVVVHAMHPGWVDTEGVRRFMPTFHRLTAPILRSPAEGADTIVWLGAAPEPLRSTGLFWQDRRPRPTHYRLGAGPEADGERGRLWDFCCEQLVAAGISEGAALRGAEPTPTPVTR
jgi:NAD(P)-dependent dehydrogenase (short-subunit alcohol dehydrogenase family)